MSILIFLTSLIIHSSQCVWVADVSQTISVLYKDGEFEVLPGLNYYASVVAWARFTNEQLTNGWMHLEITTNEHFPDEIQAQASGFAEGYLTKESIYNYYQEFYSTLICNENIEDFKDVCASFKDALKTNEEYIKKSVREKASTQPKWHMVDMFYKQLDGMKVGFLAKYKENNEEIGSQDFDLEHGFLLLNFLADIWDYMEKFKLEQAVGKEVNERIRPSCSVLIKHLSEIKELFVGHNTWHEYAALGYKFLKKYNLNYHLLPDSPELVPGHTLTMSSYTATIISLDDFLTTSSGLATTETTLNIYNSSLYTNLDSSSQLFEPVRVMAANRLATNGQEWTNIMSEDNGGTYNNQWMIIDYSKIQKNGSLDDGTLWVYEQLPGRTWAEDQTNVLREKGFWASYNRAFYPEVHRLSGGEEMAEKFGEYFSYTDTPRAMIMAREQAKVVDEESMTEFMRYNDFQNDPDAQVQGCNQPIPAGSIANRLDLTLPGSECEFEDLDQMIGHKGYGALDMKVVTRRLMAAGQQFWAVAGPMHNDQVTPFSWANTNLTDSPQYTPITTFDFQPEVKTWGLKGINQVIY